MDFLQELIDDGMCNMIDDRLSKFLSDDEEYDRLERELDELEKKYMKLGLDDNKKEVIDEYITGIEELKSYMYERTYFLGIKDTLALLSRFKLIKNNDIS